MLFKFSLAGSNVAASISSAMSSSRRSHPYTDYWFDAEKTVTVRYDHVPHPPLYPPPANWPACSICPSLDSHAEPHRASATPLWTACSIYTSLDSHAEPDRASVTPLCCDRAKTTALAHAARDSLAEEYEIIYPWLRPNKDAPRPPCPLPTLRVKDLPLRVRLRYMAFVQKGKQKV